MQDLARATMPRWSGWPRQEARATDPGEERELVAVRFEGGRLLLAGEMSGALSDTLLRVSEEYDRKLDTLTENLSALLEPIIIVVVGLIVAVIALGVISPIYGLVNQIQ